MQRKRNAVSQCFSAGQVSWCTVLRKHSNLVWIPNHQQGQLTGTALLEDLPFMVYLAREERIRLLPDLISVIKLNLVIKLDTWILSQLVSFVYEVLVLFWTGFAYFWRKKKSSTFGSNFSIMTNVIIHWKSVRLMFLCAGTCNNSLVAYTSVRLSTGEGLNLPKGIHIPSSLLWHLFSCEMMLPGSWLRFWSCYGYTVGSILLQFCLHEMS